jgi:hypothetical protein
MARKLIVEVIADADNFVRGLKGAEKASTQFAAEVTVSSKKVVDAQIAASVKTQARLREQITLYRQVAASAERGSAEQIAASRLAADAQNRLQRELGQTSVSYGRASESVSHFERELSKSVRGALSGTGVFKGLTRSLAFASGGYLAFRGVTESIQKTIEVAQGAAVAERSLATQMRATGESFKDNQAKIEQAENSLAKYGFTSDDSAKALTILDRATGSITRSMGLQLGVANLARAKNIDLAAAAAVVAKVFGGQETALRRAVPGLDKQAHGLELIAEAYAKLRGQAAAATTPSEKFSAVLFDTEKIIGTALLPVMNKYLDSVSKWLDKANRTGEIQRDAAAGVGVLKDAISVLKTAVDGLKGAFDVLNSVTGSTKESLKLLLGVLVAFKTAKIAQEFLGIAGGVKQVGANAEQSKGKVKGLQGGLTNLSANPYRATIEIYAIYKGATGLAGLLDRAGLGKAAYGWGSKAYDIAHFLHLAGPSGSPPEITPMNPPGLAGAVGTPAQVAGSFPGGPPGLTGAAGTPRPGASVGQRNTWFDQMISRSLDRVQDIPTLRGQISRLRQIAALVQERIAATKDVTRKLTLGDTLVGITRQIAGDQKQVAQNAKDAQAAAQQQLAADRQRAIDVADLAVQRAGLAGNTNAILGSLQRERTLLEQQLSTDRGNLTLQQKLLDVEGQIRDLQKQRADAAKQARQDAAQQAQQAALHAGQVAIARAGLTSSLSDDITAQQNYLALQRKQHADQLDIIATQKTIQDLRQQQLDSAAAAAKTALDTATQTDQTTQQVQRVVFKYMSATALVNRFGQGLTYEQKHRLEVGLAMTTPTGAAPGTPHLFTIHGGVHMHGVQDVAGLENQIAKRAKARPQIRRGARG